MTRLSAILVDEAVGFIEVEIFEEGERLSRHGGWADIGNPARGPGLSTPRVGSWLLGEAAGWLDLAGVDRLLDYSCADPNPDDGNPAGYRAFLERVGFHEVTRTALDARSVIGEVRFAPSERPVAADFAHGWPAAVRERVLARWSADYGYADEPVKATPSTETRPARS